MNITFNNEKTAVVTAEPAASAVQSLKHCLSQAHRLR